MTERVNSLTLIFKESIRVDDIEALRKALYMIEGVIEVKANKSYILAEEIGFAKAEKYYLNEIFKIFERNNK